MPLSEKSRSRNASVANVPSNQEALERFGSWLKEFVDTTMPDLPGISDDVFSRLVKMARFQTKKRCFNESEDAIHEIIRVILHEYTSLKLIFGEKLYWEDAAQWAKFVGRKIETVTKEYDRAHKRQHASYDDGLSTRHRHTVTVHSAKTAELSLEVKEALATLPPHLKQCLVAKHFHHLSIEEIAAENGVNRSTVNRWLLLAGQELRTRLGPSRIAMLLAATGVVLKEGTSAAADVVRKRPIGGSSHVAASSTGSATIGTQAVTTSFAVFCATAATGVAIWVFVLFIRPTGSLSEQLHDIHVKRVEAEPMIHALAARDDTTIELAAMDPIDVETQAADPIEDEPAVFPGGFPRHPKPSQLYSLPFYGLDIGIDFAWVPDGPNTKGFWMGRTELTQKQYLGLLSQHKGIAVANPSTDKGSERPVESITPLQMVAFATSASEYSGIQLRLATLAEWHFAAAGGESGLNRRLNPEELDRMAWYQPNGGNEHHPVGLKQPNGYNLCDLYGNVFEVVTAPRGGFQMCGGCFCFDGGWCIPQSKTDCDVNRSERGIGFRLVHQPEEFAR